MRWFLRSPRGTPVLAAACVAMLWSGAAAAQVSISEFPLPTAASGPTGIAAGPDGNLWFTAYEGNFIGRITPAGAVTEFPLPLPASGPHGITAGPDGNVWFTEALANRIGRITPSGTITKFSIPTAVSLPLGITSGPDGNLWFTEGFGNRIGRITPNGAITEFVIPTGASFPSGITAGPDGNLWFTETDADQIGRITPNGVITEYFLPTLLGSPEGITAGPDGNLWFTQPDVDQIGRIATVGAVVEFALPALSRTPLGIAGGADGNVWFAEFDGNRIGRITSTGTVAEYALPTPDSFPTGITLGSDGALWFTENGSNQIGRSGPVSIAGRTRYYSNGGSVAAATVLLSGQSPSATQTDDLGDYSFADLTVDEWTVEPQKIGDWENGISSLDAAHVLQVVTLKRSFDDLQRLACDVTGNGTISSLDATRILQLVVAKISQLPVAETCGSDWAFIPAPEWAANQTLLEPQATGGCQRGAIQFSPLAGKALDQDFQAVLFGDCTGNWQPSSGGGAARQGSELAHRGRARLGFPRRSRGRRVVVPLRVRSSAAFVALDAHLTYDPSRVRIRDVQPHEGHAAALDWRDDDGNLRVAFASAEPARARKLFITVELERPGMDAGLRLMTLLIDDGQLAAERLRR